MSSASRGAWIPLSRIESFIQLDPAFAIVGLALGAWLTYKVLLRNVSEERHKNLRGLFSNLVIHLSILTVLLFAYFGARHFSHQDAASADALNRASVFIGLLAILSGCIVFVKAAKILTLEYLFVSNMRAGVPILLVNLFTLLLSIFLGSWILTELFNIRLAPLLATSAMFSLVLGLALQDTLGNLFAGVALQFDKPYEIGDWIEVQVGLQKWVGKVYEITWRATVLIGLNDERITVPNRVISQAQVSNYSNDGIPICRSQLFRFPYSTDPEQIKKALLAAVKSVSAIRNRPAPTVYAWESTESWISFKLIYYVDDYGLQWQIADQVLIRVLAELKSHGIQLAAPRMAVSMNEGETHAFQAS